MNGWMTLEYAVTSGMLIDGMNLCFLFGMAGGIVFGYALCKLLNTGE